MTDADLTETSAWSPPISERSGGCWNRVRISSSWAAAAEGSCTRLAGLADTLRRWQRCDLGTGPKGLGPQSSTSSQTAMTISQTATGRKRRAARPPLRRKLRLLIPYGAKIMDLAGGVLQRYGPRPWTAAT